MRHIMLATRTDPDAPWQTPTSVPTIDAMAGLPSTPEVSLDQRELFFSWASGEGQVPTIYRSVWANPADGDARDRGRPEFGAERPAGRLGRQRQHHDPVVDERQPRLRLRPLHHGAKLGHIPLRHASTGGGVGHPGRRHGTHALPRRPGDRLRQQTQRASAPSSSMPPARTSVPRSTRPGPSPSSTPQGSKQIPGSRPI